MQRLALFLGALIWALPALAAADETIAYTYDAQGRLTKVNRAGPENLDRGISGVSA